jgi:hypothetical protein
MSGGRFGSFDFCLFVSAGAVSEKANVPNVGGHKIIF